MAVQVALELTLSVNPQRPRQPHSHTVTAPRRYPARHGAGVRTPASYGPLTITSGTIARGEESLTVIRQATMGDVPYIDGLRRKESESLSFLPLSAYEREIEDGGKVIVAEEGGDLVGFLYATHNKGVARVHQVAIQEDARRMARAALLVKAAQKDTDWLISLRCASDLDAVDFWSALGFDLTDREGAKPPQWKSRESTRFTNRRGRVMLRFQKVVGGLWLPNTRAVLSHKER
jgi:N-acetylglutamate synthase-like GNAT family acetyltransferase